AKRHVDVGEGSTGEVRLDLEDDPAEVRAAGGDLRLSVSESAPVVLVDGKPEPGLASALRLAPGPHRVRVERAGFFPVERDVDVPARGALDVRVVLEPTADTRAAYVSKNRTMKTLGFVGLLGGAALVGAGAAVALVGNGVKSTASDDLTSLRKNGVKGFDCSADGNPTPIQQTCTQLRDRYDGDFSRGKAMLNGGLVGAGVGVAAIAAGVVLLVAADDPHRYDKKPGEQLAARVRPEFAFSGRGGALGLRVDF
ncbi:MAG TPA: hypothetical protein VHB21_23880, partial [Minicystis sp.]|nr:hypothetical protein [Minicystis sp.]